MTACELSNLTRWMEAELGSVPEAPIRRIIAEAANNLDSLVCWPAKAELLWQGCDRSVKYHNYPWALREAVRRGGVTADSRSNGPAITAYLVAGGTRPQRAGNHDWTIHHLYDGKFPYPGSKRPSLRAVTDPRHFTQSAGVVAIHPIADAIADEYACFAWRLRAESFLRFGYDPDGVFGSRDELGFSGRACSKVWHCG